MSLLGPELHDLTLEDVQRFLDGADSEPLLWEAKGTDMRPDNVRKAVCAFANGRQTAYLILGANNVEGCWQLDGVNLHGDPPAWVSDVIHDGLDPVPLVDVRSLAIDGSDGFHVAVVEVPPVAILPVLNIARDHERPPDDPLFSSVERDCAGLQASGSTSPRPASRTKATRANWSSRSRTCLLSASASTRRAPCCLPRGC